MTLRSPGAAVSRLASMPLVLAAPRGGRVRRLAFAGAGALALAAAFALGATAAPWLGSAPLAPQAAAQAAAQAELRQARQALEQARLQQRVSGARGQELENQVDALNQGLRQCQVDLAFYRGAHDGPRRPAPRS